MANNRIQVKRTSVTGRTANTTDSGNSQYIYPGELALNMTDGIMFSSNDSVLITVGSNLVNQNVSGNLTVKAIIANGSLGTDGNVLVTNGSAVYWTSVGGTGTVTSVATGNGMIGGPITTNGTISILANTGIVANSTGAFVNSTYINTLTANNTSFVGSVSAANVVSNSQLSSNLANYQTTAGLTANVATLTANNATNLGGLAADAYVQNTDSRTLSGNLVFSGANIVFTGIITVSNIETANGAAPLTLKTGNTSGPSIIVNTSSDITIASNSTSNNIVLTPTSIKIGANSSVNTFVANSIGSHFIGNVSIVSLLANGSLGTANQVLTSNSTGIHWSSIFSSVTSNALTTGTTYTTPSNLISALVFSTGAGGGGGGSDSDGSGAGAGSGGGAGGTTVRSYTAAELGATVTYAIGAAGTAGSSSGGNGGTGGTTTFTPSGGGTALSSIGGGAGAGLDGSIDRNRTTGAAGGIPTGGILNIDGGDGADGVTYSAGEAVPAAIGGGGGSSFWGGGGKGSVSFGAGIAGAAGAAYGSGGGGSGTSDSTTGAVGGAGRAGVIFIVEFKT